MLFDKRHERRERRNIRLHHFAQCGIGPQVASIAGVAAAGGGGGGSGRWQGPQQCCPQICMSDVLQQRIHALRRRNHGLTGRRDS